MSVNYSEEFKQQTVQKVLNRGHGVTMADIATPLGVAMSTLYRWTTSYQRTTSTGHNNKIMTTPSNEKRPEDWTKEQRFNAIMACHALTPEKISAYCRTQGIYPHHIEQWKLDFLGNNSAPESVVSALKLRQLSKQNQKLQRELIRKDKAFVVMISVFLMAKAKSM